MANNGSAEGDFGHEDGRGFESSIMEGQIGGVTIEGGPIDAGDVNKESSEGAEGGTSGGYGCLQEAVEIDIDCVSAPVVRASGLVPVVGSSMIGSTAVVVGATTEVVHGLMGRGFSGSGQVPSSGGSSV